MHDLHISDFCKDTARIILNLYRRFPTKSTLYMEDICGPDTPDEFGLHSPRFIACFSATLWLAEEGYIRFGQTVQQEAIEDAVLTQKCFTHFSSFSGVTLNKAQTRIQELEFILRNKNSDTLIHYMIEQLQS